MKSSTAVVERDSETGLYVGYVPGVPGAHSQGGTLEELNANLREVIARDGGDLLLRLRSAELKGAMEYLGAPQRIEMGVTRTYTNRIELRRRGTGIVADGVYLTGRL